MLLRNHVIKTQVIQFLSHYLSQKNLYPIKNLHKLWIPPEMVFFELKVLKKNLSKVLLFNLYAICWYFY